MNPFRIIVVIQVTTLFVLAFVPPHGAMHEIMYLVNGLLGGHLWATTSADKFASLEW